jgi:predicted signal transduction protein with EAL and GGDEF domain
VDSETLLSQGDVALYRAKAQSRGIYSFFTDAMDEEVRNRVTLGVELREALTRDQLTLRYQPQINNHDGPHHRGRGTSSVATSDARPIQPSRFIPIAERTGLISALGTWVLKESCRQLRIWREAGLAVDHVAVNLSALQFKTPRELERDVLAIVTDSGLPPSSIELELTETALMTASRDHDDVLAGCEAAVYGWPSTTSGRAIRHSTTCAVPRGPDQDRA